MNFYDSIIEGAQELTVQERGQLYAACLEYLYFEGRMPEFDMKPAVRALFISHKVSFDRQLKRKAAGRNGGSAKGESKARYGNRNASKTQAAQHESPTENASKTQENASRPPSKTQAKRKQTQVNTQAVLFEDTQAKRKQNASEQEQEQEVEKPPTDVGGQKRRTRFVPPSVEDVARVARERSLTLVDPEAFWAHYDAQGWVNGNGVPIANWESKLISWNSAERLRRQEARQGGAYDATYD